MPRDRRLTTTKLARAKAALDELLACSDLEYRDHIERARRAVDANARWHADEVAAGAASAGEEDEGEPPPRYPLPDGTYFNPGDGSLGFGPFAGALRAAGYSMTSKGTYAAADEAEVRRFQSDAGIHVDGVVGVQSWVAAFATGPGTVTPPS